MYKIEVKGRSRWSASHLQGVDAAINSSRLLADAELDFHRLFDLFTMHHHGVQAEFVGIYPVISPDKILLISCSASYTKAAMSSGVNCFPDSN